MFRFENLTKSYPIDKKSKDNTQALEDLNFNIPVETATAIIGQNGSGKSTLLSILSGQVTDFEGNVWINEDPIHQFYEKNKVGFAGEEIPFKQRFKVRRVLQEVGTLQGLEGAALENKLLETVERFQLSDILERPFKTLSKGMKQRVNLAQSLMTRSSFIFWDEPTSGLDWVFTELVENVLAELKREGKTVLYSTHDLAIAKRVSSESVVHLKDARLRFAGSFTRWEIFLQIYADQSERCLLL